MQEDNSRSKHRLYLGELTVMDPSLGDILHGSGKLPVGSLGSDGHHLQGIPRGCYKPKQNYLDLFQYIPVIRTR